jgi:hypothetical protein
VDGALLGEPSLEETKLSATDAGGAPRIRGERIGDPCATHFGPGSDRSEVEEGRTAIDGQLGTAITSIAAGQACGAASRGSGATPENGGHHATGIGRATTGRGLAADAARSTPFLGKDIGAQEAKGEEEKEEES